jgi:hypothetical protein
MRTGSSVRSIVSFFFSGTAGAGVRLRVDRLDLVVGGVRLVALLAGLVILDDVDAHFGQGGGDVLDLVGGHLALRQGLVQLVVGDVAALLGAGDDLLDRRVGQIEQGRVRRVGRLGRVRRHICFRRHQCSSSPCARASSLA